MTTHRLFTPGPVEIPPRVLAAMSRTDVHHRTKEFVEVFGRTADRFGKIIDCEHRPLFLACTGTGALEAALINTVSAQESFLYVSAGKFGERWGKIAGRHEIDGIAIEAAWGDSPSLEQIADLCQKYRHAKAFCIQHCETSTGVLHPIEKIIPLVRKECPEAVIIVDAISSVTTVPLSCRELEIDLLICASQKALQLPPGLTVIGLSKKGIQRIHESKPRSLYFDLKHELKNQQQGTSSWTPAIAHILGLDEVCQMIEEEGLEQMIARHAALRDLCRRGLQLLRCTPVAERFPSNSITPATPPAGINSEDFRKVLQREHNILIAGGQDHWKGGYFRVGHMGSLTLNDMREFLQLARDVLLGLHSEQPSREELQALLIENGT